MNEILAKNLMQTDVNQAAQLVRSMLTEKYISPIQKAVSNENKRVKKNPCKNTRLLEALKPFVGRDAQHSLTSTIDILHTIQTIQGMTKQIPPQSLATSEQARDSISTNSVHPDGIYDIDSACVGFAPQNPNSSQNFMMMLMLMLLMR